MKTETTNQNLLSEHPDEKNSISMEKNAKHPPSDDIFRKVKVSNALNPPSLSVNDESGKRNTEDLS